MTGRGSFRLFPGDLVANRTAISEKGHLSVFTMSMIFPVIYFTIASKSPNCFISGSGP
jgi:hypothetical protein